MMKDLMGFGADPKAKAPDGSGAVFLAAGSKKLDAVKMLVEMGLDVNEAPRGRGSAPHTAVKAGSNDIVQYLADHGADFSIKANFGRTPLEEALFEAPKPTIELMQKLTAERQR
jgi:ankyrin repeat protein